MLAHNLPHFTARTSLYMPRRARLFLIAVGVLGLSVALYGAWTWRVDNVPKFVAYLVAAVLASQLKVGLPEVTGTMSVNFLFILIGIAELNFNETLALGCAAILSQCLIRPGKGWPKAEHLLFNASSAAIAVGVAYYIYHGPLHVILKSFSLLLMLSACVYFLLNSLPVAT